MKSGEHKRRQDSWRRHVWIALPVAIVLVAVTAAWLIIQRGTVSSEPGGQAYEVVECGTLDNASFSCWQDRFQAIVSVQTPETAFTDFKKQSSINPYVKSNCHQLGHVIGRAAALKYPSLSEAYKHGDDFCWSGYYHGATETAAKKIGKDKIVSQLQTVCQDFYKTGRYSFNHYNCVHGMGHGLMALQDGELFTSLKSCDSYSDDWERSSCYGGVFMENVMNEINPGKHSSYLRQDEPLYPCTSVEDRYKEQCYLMQTSHALIVVGQDYNKVFQLCAGVADPYDAICYQSLGRDISGQSSSDQTRTIVLCMQGTDYHARENCFTGAVKDFISYHHDDTQALAMCSMIPDATLITSCTQLGRQYFSTF